MGQYQANLAPKEQKTLIGLIRKQNIVKLYINDKPVDILWHTGANVSTISKEYVNNFFPNVVIKNLHGILSDAEKLQVRCGNQVILPYEGYVELEVSLDNDTPADSCTIFNHSRNITLPNTTNITLHRYKRTHITKLPIK